MRARFTAGVSSILMPLQSVVSYDFPQWFHINFDLRHKRMKQSSGMLEIRPLSYTEKGGMVPRRGTPLESFVIGSQ